MGARLGRRRRARDLQAAHRGGAWWGDAVHGPVYLDGDRVRRLRHRPLGDDRRLRVRARSTPPTRPRRATSRSSTRSGWIKSEAVTANTLCVRMNVNQPPFDNQEVRNAVQLAVDNAVVLDLGYQGLGASRENHHVGPMHPEYAELPPSPRDPETRQGADDRGRPGRHRVRADLARRRPQPQHLRRGGRADARRRDERSSARCCPATPSGTTGSAIPSRRPSGTCARSACRSTRSPTAPACRGTRPASRTREFDELLDQSWPSPIADKRRELMAQDGEDPAGLAASSSSPTGARPSAT